MTGRVFTIEADPGLRAALAESLEEAGYEAVFAHDGPKRAPRDRVAPDPSSREFAAVVVSLPAPEAWSLASVPPAPLILLQRWPLVGELERWLGPPHPHPRILLTEPISEGRLVDALERAIAGRPAPPGRAGEDDPAPRG